ncbi:MAG: hypothetical protein H0U10_09370 [Chloroflexia bacterium]|nr:hypothetical protein [Chloroflexia bacterium]
MAQIPDDWLDEASFPDAAAHRAAYAAYLEARLAAADLFLDAAVAARASLPRASR